MTIKTSDSNYEIIEKIKKKLEEKLDQDSQEYKLYFSGECDFNQTTFERKSNHLEICVLANDDVIGFSLLYLLRIIIDNNDHLLHCIIGDKERDEMSIDDYIAELSKWEQGYSSVFKLNQIPEVTLYNGPSLEEKIKKQLWQIDIWTFERIFSEIYDVVDN